MSKRILIIEDQEDNRQIIHDVLGANGYESLEAISGEEGLTIAAREKPDLILMDIQLPGMDGRTALGELRKDPATVRIPVIAVTASVMPIERKEILAAGFDGYQAKPLSVKDLLAEVRHVLDRAAESHT